jgi:hypothetical protein
MPGLEIFGRLLPVASDDFFPLALIHSLPHTASFSLALYLIGTHSHCSSLTFLTTQLFLSLLDLLLDILMMWMSLRGTIAYSKPRRHVGKILYAGMITATAQLGNTMYGIVRVHQSEWKLCEPSKYAWLVVLIYWNLAIVMIDGLFLFLSLFSSQPARVAESERPRHVRRALQPLFWSAAYLNRDHPISPKDILKDVAGILTELFGSRAFCASDVLAGLILVRKRQLYESVSERTYANEIGDSIASPTTGVRFGPAPVDAFAPTILNVPRIAYLSQYAESMYGIPLYLFADIRRGLSYMCCPHAQEKVTSAVMAVERSMDTGCTYLLCCFPGTYLETPEHPDLLYASLKGRLFKSPFAVSVDHRIKTVVIATRGTLSTTDLLVDLYIKEKVIQWDSNGQMHEAITHHGIFEIASTIFQEIQERGVFDLIQERYPDYELVCTGHSLGAAVSSLLAFLIKTSKDTFLIGPRTVAVCYSTPACIISKEAIPFFQTFCTSVILGDDFICRLNPRNVHILRERIDAELRHCHRRKFELITSELISRIFTKGYRTMPSFEIPTLEPIPEPDVNPTFLPGNVLHFIRSGVSVSTTSATEDGLLSHEDDQGVFQPYWVHSATLGQEMIISTSMAMDHLPNRVGNVLRTFLPPDDTIYS